MRRKWLARSGETLLRNDMCIVRHASGLRRIAESRICSCYILFLHVRGRSISPNQKSFNEETRTHLTLWLDRFFFRNTVRATKKGGGIDV